MKITICDVNAAVWQACRDIMADTEIEVLHTSILDHPWDAVVSPANSFGFMDGGIDAIYTYYFGPGVQDDLQKKIRELPFGELLVGQSLLVDTGDKRIPKLIAAPTMRVPMRIDDPIDILLATRAAIHAGKQAGLKSIALPGMGTGCGNELPHTAARAMWAGIQQAMREVSFPISWAHARDRHFKLFAE